MIKLPQLLSSNSKRSQGWKTFLTAVCIAGLGTLLAAIHLWHAVSHAKPLAATIVGAIIPFGLAVSLVGAGYWLGKQGHRFDQPARVCLWTYIGALAMTAMAGLIVFHQYLTGTLLDDSFYILANATTGGALGGVIIGVYEGHTRRRTQRIAALHEGIRTLLNHQTKEDVCNEAVNIIRDSLKMPTSAVWLYNSESDALEPASMSEQAEIQIGEHPAFQYGESISWEVFEHGEERVFADVSSRSDAYNPDTSVKSEIILPIGNHGVINIGSLRKDAFDDVDVMSAKILANTMKTILDRADREQSLEEQQEHLERQASQLEEFASIVSHDLRNPLSVAEGYLDLAHETGEDLYFEKVGNALSRMETIIEDMLWLSREGREIGELEAVDLEELAQAAWEFVDTQEAILECECDRYVCADKERLQQLFENLFRNAVEYGGNSVTVTVGTTERGFNVEDTGPGIPDDKRTEIFEPGYSTGEQGTGYGLSIVQTIVEAHGWEIAVTEAEDGGAKFEIKNVEQVTEACCVEGA